MSVDIIKFQPTAKELLASRLSRGWQPTASQLKTGPKIDGYAACLYEK